MNRRDIQATQAVQVSSEDSNKFICYICDTEIPNTHMREHLHGNKHQTCLLIAEVALERAKNQLCLELQPLYEHDPCTYFCDPCSLVLLKCEKTRHENSVIHVENLQYYNVLRTFSAFYMNREDPCPLRNVDSIRTASSPCITPQICNSKEKAAELQTVITHLKEATSHLQSPEGSMAHLDPHLNKALTGLKRTVDRTLHELQETVAKKELVFDKAIDKLKVTAEKTLSDLKESAEIKHQTDMKRSKLSEEAELEIAKFKSKLSRINVIRKNKKQTNLPKQM